MKGPEHLSIILQRRERDVKDFGGWVLKNITFQLEEFRENKSGSIGRPKAFLAYGNFSSFVI